jgi:glycerol-3-phosphate acyltransferase PlsY
MNTAISALIAHLLDIVIAVLMAYLLGSIPFALVMSRAFGLADPRTYGSGNPGATNVLRSGNRQAAALTLLLDAAKGTLAVVLASAYADRIGGEIGVALVAVAVFLGHLFPVFIGFRGGKGMATAFGILFGIAWWFGFLVGAVWLLVALASRYSSLASLGAAVVAPIAYFSLLGAPPMTVALVVIGLGVIARHHGNIRKLLAGTESRIGNKTGG